MDATAFERMAFQHPFRRYQRLALSWVESVLGTDEDDGRFHLVAPPGSGKTILGLELVRRFARPAVVFAPTSAIQQQWATQVDMFLAEGTRDGLVSTDPARLAPITVLTYQVVSTTAAADEPLDALARERWCQELIDARQVADAEAAVQRLDTLQANNPRGYARELARRHRRVKRDLLRSGDVDILRFLHPNAVDLLDRLAAAGVGTVVLDECHHLLDHWAVVLRTLIGRLEQPRVIGLTATLPDPDTPEEHENYDALLGPVDIQVPTPAVVKEGELAPYRDLVWFVEPTPGERRYLDDIQMSFEHALQEVTTDPRFRDWLTASLGADDPERWMQVLRDDPVWAAAGMRVLHALGLPASERLTVPVQAEQPPTPLDRAQVIGRYGLSELKTSADPADHDRLARLRRVLQPFGFVLGEQGIRQSRSPGDLVVAYSESKQAAVAEILAREHAALGDRLRAIVVTDFERAGRRIAHAGGALPADAGSARHTFRTLLADPGLRDLDPVLLTGSTLWVDADIADRMVADLNHRLQAKGLSTRCEATRFDGWRGAEISAEGGAWSTRIYVRLVTELFEAGVTQCIVGTRGLLGEGWDALRLNTLVDLTSVTTSQSVQQLRGRSIRLDPSWPTKVAHNWDVICVAPAFDRGDRDLRRFTARHRHLWGATPVSRLQERVNDAIAGAISLTDPSAILPPPIARGDIVRGVGHVDPALAHDLAWREWKDVDLSAATRRSAAAIGDRADSHELWGVGEPYANDDRWIARINPVDLRIRTAHTVEDTLRALLRTLRSTLLGAAALLAWLIVRYGLDAGGRGLMAVIGISLALITALLAVRAGPLAWRILKELVAGQPRDHVIGDIGHAVLEGLRDAGLVSPVLLPEHVRVAPQADGTIDVLLEHAPQVDAEVFVEAMGQVLGPIDDPRYLILRDDRRLPDVGLRWLWVPLRQFVAREGHLRPDHHPVPDLLGVNRSRADAFAAAWQRHVGGGELVYTRSDDGWRVLLEARSRDRPTAPTWAFERWS
jgi:superfamily II DNA or RNA helicase